MEVLRKAQKIHKCDICKGNIQKGEIYKYTEIRQPRFDSVIDGFDIQVGIIYYKYREHNKDCFPRLLYYEHQKEIIKNCNFGKHNPTFDKDPDSYDNKEWCKWCGKEL